MNWREITVPDHVLAQQGQSTPSDNNKLGYWLDHISRCNCESDILKAVAEFRIHKDWNDEERAAVGRCYIEKLTHRR